MPLEHALARNTNAGDAHEIRSPTRTNLMRKQHRLAITATLLLSAPLAAQTRPAITTDTAGGARPGRPVPGPVYETAAFSRAVDRGTRTRSGQPGPKYWTQRIRYAIDATLDPAAKRIRGREHVVYVNHSPDALRQLAVHLYQNVFAPGAPRREPVPTTDGMPLTRVAVNGQPIRAAPATASANRAPAGTYVIDNTVLWIALSSPLSPNDSVSLDVAWSYAPAPSPSDGRQGRESDVYVAGYWYPQIAVYDDVNGWVADPYLLEAEFYMEPADYDVRVTAPRGWVVGATGTLVNADSILSSSARARIADARRTGDVVHVVTPAPDASAALAGRAATATWHFTAANVRDFAWGAANHCVWDATRALVWRGDGAADTVMINSFYRRSAPAAAWAVGGARYTRDAIQGLSDYLWPYPWPQMTSIEGVLTGGGMEYPMMTAMQPWADTLSLAGDLMHETGHMWFPMQVGSSETRYPWMDEGFTQFDAAQAMRVLYGEPRSGGRLNDSEQGQRTRYLRLVRTGDDAPLMTLGDNMPRDAYTLYYDKTSQVLATLRSILGDSTFHRAFREYGHRWVGKHPYPYDFFNTMADVSGRDLSWFWSTWLYEAWPLDQAIESVTQRGDSVSVVIEDRGLAPMPVRLAITRAGGAVQRVELPVDAWLRGERQQTVHVAATPAITKIEIDPDAHFPDVDRRNQAWTPGR
jgi:hypothetical protein